ncbi:MAG: tRNA lysidine(34) synthetase TilS, partial [Eubacteriales bacterium]|nr:tRNA lysidine(34) synthetase TilS [Eubacteriales bacterium]
MTERVLESVRGALKRAGLWGANARLLAAVSGGSDSAVLLHALCALRAEGGYTLLAAHVEHGLRGESSRADAAFVRALCERLSVPFLCRSAALDPALPGVEARAREARYALLEGMADECRADALLTAHHQGDQAETVLLHLLRGSGARGLSGMRECAAWQHRLLVRPLLALSKADLWEALGDEPCREDETNAQRGCGRNRLRLDVLPMLERERPGAQARIAQAADRLRGDDDCLTGLAEALLQKSALTEPPFFCVSREALAKAHPAIAVRALRMLALRALPPMDERTLSYE